MIGRPEGRIVATRGALLEAELPLVRCGDVVDVHGRGSVISARVTALQGTRVVLAPWGSAEGLARGDRVVGRAQRASFALGTALLGRAIDGRGHALDGGHAPRAGRSTQSIETIPIADRRPCTAVFVTGVRAIDGPLAFGRGARIGIFGAPGAGKSHLIDAIVRGCDADAIVVALVGERGREAERWISARTPRMSIVCATGDRSAAERVRCAEVGFAQASALRERGLDVLLVVDSLARTATALREIALANGEAPGRGGFPPSVFAVLTRLVESAGRSAQGSVTLVATVLSDGDDERDPVSDAARAALDGHLILSDRLARSGHFPAIDIVASASRTFADVASAEQCASSQLVRAAVAALEESHEARALGIDASGSDPFLARAIACEPSLEAFLRQDTRATPFSQTLAQFTSMAAMLA